MWSPRWGTCPACKGISPWLSKRFFGSKIEGQSIWVRALFIKLFASACLGKQLICFSQFRQWQPSDSTSLLPVQTWGWHKVAPRCIEHRIGSSVLDNFKPSDEKCNAFSHAEAPSDEIDQSLAIWTSVCTLLIRFCNFNWHNGLSQSLWKIGYWDNSVRPSFCMYSLHLMSKNGLWSSLMLLGSSEYAIWIEAV